VGEKTLTAWARRLAILACALSLAACAVQPREEVRVSIGTGEPRPEMTKHYASLYLPYAMMATAAYSDPKILDAHHCPDMSKLGVRAFARDDDDFRFHRTVQGWIAQLSANAWECRFGVVGSLGRCPPRLPGCDLSSGLEFHVWRRMQNGCREVVVAFRGTDKDDLGDWRSNFRWFHRLKPKFDQYDQVRTHMGLIVERIDGHGCAGVPVTTAGHSLGGGLAQQAAYAHWRVRYVYAFDPSPVTGFFDVSAMQREANVVGLGIDRAYESGEVLSLPRHILEGIYPPAACNPRIRIVRFSLLTGPSVRQHNMESLTKEMRTFAAQRGANARRALAHDAALHCDPRLPST
jgi:pimeloyl-ACP methyl ester carboxylesterase